MNCLKTSRRILRASWRNLKIEMGDTDNMTMSSLNHTETHQRSILDTPEGKAQLSIYVLTFLLGSFGNVLVLLVVRSKKHRTVNDLFIVNLAISDLLMIGFLPVYSAKILVQFHHSTAFCKSVFPIATMTFFVSIFTLTSMAIHRCYVITNPFKPEMRKWKIMAWLVGVWVASFIAVLPLVLAIEGGLPGTADCPESWHSDALRKAYTACLFVLQYSLPLAVITAAYIRIAVDLLKSSTERFGPGKSLNNNRRDGNALSRLACKEDIQVLKTVAVIVLVFAICLLPLQLRWMMLDFGGETQRRIAGQVFVKFDVLLSIFHSCLNPLVYGTLTRRFRRGYIRYLICLCPCFKDRVPNGTASTTGYHYQDCSSPTNQNGSALDHVERTPLGRESPEHETKSTEV